MTNLDTSTIKELRVELTDRLLSISSEIDGAIVILHAAGLDLSNVEQTETVKLARSKIAKAIDLLRTNTRRLEP